MPDPFAGFRPDRNSPEPLHEQLTAFLQALIVHDVLAPRSQLPAEPVLANVLGVSRGTLRRSTATLLERGLLTQHHGRGTFVAQVGPSIEAPFVSEITSLAQSLSLRGVPTSTRVVALDRQPADERTAEALEVEPGTEVIRLDRVRADGAGPVMRLVNLVRPDLVPLDDGSELADRSLYDLFEDRGLPAGSARRRIGATVADTELSELLDVAVGHPILHIEQLSRLTDGRPLEFSDVWIRAERLELEVHVRRDG